MKIPVLEREKLILNERSYHWITERICGVIENRQPFLWWILFIPSALIALIGVVGGLTYLGFDRGRGMGKHQPCDVGMAHRELRFLDWYWSRRNTDLGDSFPDTPKLANLD